MESLNIRLRKSAYQSSLLGYHGAAALAREAADRIEELEGILHRVAEQERKLSRVASDAHAASREVNDGFICGPFIELSDWYTFEEDD